MTEVLTDPAAELEGFLQVGIDVSRLRLIAKFLIDPLHHGERLIINRRESRTEIDGLSPDLWMAGNPATFLEVGPYLLAD